MTFREFLHPRSRRRRRFRNRVLSVAALLLLLFVLLLWLQRATGPRKVSEQDIASVQLEPPEVAAARSQGKALAAQFESRAQQPGFDPGEEDRALLRSALEHYRSILIRMGSATTIEDRHRHGELAARYDTLAAEVLYDESREAESAWRLAAVNGDHDAALQALKRAVALQAEINRDFPSARQASPNRLRMLEREVQRLRSAPLLTGALDSVSEAEEALRNDQFDAARAAFLRAQNHLRQLRDEFPDLAGETASRNERVAVQLLDVGAREIAHRVRGLVAEARRLDSDGDPGGAAALYTDALALQQRINTEFPGSTVASPRNVEDLERDRQTVLSRPLADRLQKVLKDLDEALSARRDFAAAEAVGSAYALALEMEASFPRSRLLDAQTVERVRFLNAIRDDAGALQESVFRHLQPVPGRPGWSMLNREVPQILYSKLTGSNPSSKRADLLPVEGVTLAEAMEFARRLSWLLGYEVRLPARADFLAAVEPLDPAHVRQGIWHGGNTPNREPQAVGTSTANARGFYDLLGNVSEWLLPDDNSTATGLVAGGSGRGNPITLAQIPIESRPAAERIRYNGFRVMVRLNDETR